MMNPSAPTWLVDEVQAALRSLQSDLEDLKVNCRAATEEHLVNQLVQCEERAHSIGGAFGIASWEPLSLYASRLQKILQFFREMPTRLTADSLSQLQAAVWGLSDFLQTTHDKVPCAELSLYVQYQSLGQLLAITSHPMELWASADLDAAISHWSEPDFLQRLHVQTLSQGALSDSEAAALQDQVDELILGLVRHKKADCAAKLQSLCNWRLMRSGANSQTLLATLLFNAINALTNDHLDLDVYLKRYLLGCMSWLKGHSNDGLLREAVFFNYVAWLRQPANAPTELNQLAIQAAWSPRRNSDYGHMFFGQFERDQLLLLQNSIDAARMQWSELCANDLSVEASGEALFVSAAFEKMMRCLESVYPSSQVLNLALKNVLSQAGIYKQHDVQVEVATTLLLLNSLTTDIYAVEASDIENRFDGLAERLKSASHGQPAGDFEPWMVEYQQKQGWMSAMSSTVEHLTQKLNEIESIFKHLWENPAENAALALVPEKLRQMSSVAQSLDLHHLADAINPLELQVASLVHKPQVMDSAAQYQMTSDLAALGLQLHMWVYESAPLPTTVVPHAASQAAPALDSEVDDPDESMIEVFLEEANQLFPDAHTAIRQLLVQPSETEALASLKRAFHTLKGGARVVGLMEFGDVAWLMEKHLNDSLTAAQPISKQSLHLCETQLSTMQTWVQQLEKEKNPHSVQIDWRHDALEVAIQEAQIEPLFELPPADFLDLPPLLDETPVPQPAVEPESPPTNLIAEIEESSESQVKTIGELQISIPLYQAYLNETDEWSRQLALALSEWTLDDHQPIPSQALTWAHSLSGSSATIGFTGCAYLAKLVEGLIEKIQTQSFRSSDLSKNLSFAADDICRLLHQFAAGFIKEPELELIADLEGYMAEPMLATQVRVPEIVPDAKTTTVQDAEMLAVFQEESDQLIPELGAALRGWAGAPEQEDYKKQALRVLHTLKGSARLVGKQALAQSAHDLESKIETLGLKPSAANLLQLLTAYDQLTSESALMVQTTALAKPTSMPTPLAAIVPSGETIRIQSSTVDRLVNQTGEIMVARARMEAEMSRSLRTLADMSAQVQRLSDQLRELELQTESQMQSRQAQVSDAANSFDPLELDRFTRTQELTRFMAEALGDFSTLQRSLQRGLNSTEDDLAAQLRQTRDLQRHLLRTRMVEFESISERLHRLVRMTSQELGKSVELTIQNSGQEIDRSVLERVLPAFEHLLRNAVAHGIETPHVRESKGKLSLGKINIQLTQQSNDVIVILKDDGQGIDKDALLQKAQRLALGADISTDPTELIFMSGLSTASQVSELAGRGIGLDVVRAQVQALGGRIEVNFVKDAGTSFKLILPLTTAVTQIVLVRSGVQMTGIPGNLVVNVIRAKLDDVAQAQASGQFVSGVQSYPFYRLSQLLHYKAPAAEPEHATLPVMLLQSAGQIIALHVDEVLGNQEVMIKNLGVQLAQMPALSGMTVLPTGATVLIYNPVALASVYGPRFAIAQKLEGDTGEASPSENSIANSPAISAPEKQAPLVLVVDDSITMRRVLQRLLQREGYRVSLAADGRQALESLRLEKPSLVLSDVEMPRMDGFELLQNIRASDRLRGIPVVMITSRIADKHREHAKSLGANEYLGKPYSEEELIAVLGRYASK